MIEFKPLIMSALFALTLVYGCQEENTFDQYARPDWLAGKIYTQILEYEELSTFAKCIEFSGYDTIINISGSYTAFAPTNQAFNDWLAQKPEFNSIEDIPVDELTILVKYHLVQNPWSKTQLRSLDVNGWIDNLDITNNEPRGFKRETLLLEEDRKYGIETTGIRDEENKESVRIVGIPKANWHRRVATDSRKFAPIFYSEYFDIYDLYPSDYEFYFDRPFTGGSDIYFAGARVIGDEIFAENGFIHVIDKVVEPPKNAYQILEEDYPSYSYSQFHELLNNFPRFDYNQQKTFNQPFAEQGLQVDSLFDLTFPELIFNVANEKTQPPSGIFGLPQNVTIRYHHGMMAPTNQAFEDFINEYLRIPQGWGELEDTPEFIKRIIANTYLSINAVYPSDFEEGFYNGEMDIVRLDNSTIIQKEFSSNSTFIGLNKAVVPRAFSSVTRPIFLQQGYRKVMFAIEKTGLLPALKLENKNYMLFVEPDLKTSQDSSLLYDAFKDEFSVFIVPEPEEGNPIKIVLTLSDLRTFLLNHTATQQPKGVARKEFIPNLAGNIIIFNNETGEVSGTGATTEGYYGTEKVPEFPKLLTNADNGSTYQIDNWFSFASSTIFDELSSGYPRFHDLLRKAGLVLDKEFRYTFISENELYTVFIPSEAALESADLGSLPKEELINVLLNHFVQGSLIFTDGNKPAGYYETLRKDEQSTQFSSVFTKVYIEPGIDVIQFKNRDGENYAVVPESETSNQIVALNYGGDEAVVFPQIYINAVMHEVDQVLDADNMDSR